jgi:hypothetical protein
LEQIDMEDQDFLAALTDEMEDLAESGVRQKGDQFAIWFATAILGEELEDVKERFHVGGSGDNKLDIGILDEAHDTILIVQCRYSDDPLNTTLDASVPEEAKSARDRLESVPTAGNKRRREFATRYNAQRSEDTPERVLAVGLGHFSDDARSYARANTVDLYDFGLLKDLYEVNRQLADGDAPASLTITVDHTKDVITRRSSSLEAREFITIINAREIYEAVKRHRHGLFAKNLRYKLTAKGAIAAKIKTTLLEQPDALLLFNNGLTIISTRVDRDVEKLILTHPQIINGCQTSWAIYEALNELAPAELRNRTTAELLVKIVETSDPSVISRLAVSSNQQNAITDRDLKANDPMQRQIGESFANLHPPVLYENKEGGAAALGPQRQRFSINDGRRGKPPLRVMTNTVAAQVYLAVLGAPWLSKQSKKLIFSDLYNAIFGIDQDNALRFSSKTVNPSFEVAKGADNFRDDVLFGFAVMQLADGLRAIYEVKLALMDEVDAKMRTPVQTTARDLLQSIGAYHKRWHYLLIASIAEVARLWAAHRRLDINEVRSHVVGNDLNLFFGSTRGRQALFNADTSLDHSYLLDDANPSVRFPTFARWARTLSSQLEILIDSNLSRETQGREAFRMQYFIDQRQATFEELGRWIRVQYTRGPAKWSETFPLG